MLIYIVQQILCELGQLILPIAHQGIQSSITDELQCNVDLLLKRKLWAKGKEKVEEGGGVWTNFALNQVGRCTGEKVMEHAAV
jgi:hypothetical protein